MSDWETTWTKINRGLSWLKPTLTGFELRSNESLLKYIWRSLPSLLKHESSDHDQIPYIIIAIIWDESFEFEKVVLVLF